MFYALLVVTLAVALLTSVLVARFFSDAVLKILKSDWWLVTHEQGVSEHAGGAEVNRWADHEVARGGQGNGRELIAHAFCPGAVPVHEYGYIGTKSRAKTGECVNG